MDHTQKEQSHSYLYEQLSQLSLALGNAKYNVNDSVEYLLKKHSFDNDDPHELVVLNNLRLRFEKMQQMGDSRNHDLIEIRANLCMHLYRQLVRAELDESKRFVYFKFCYELFDEGEPQNMSEEDTLKYRLQVIDHLNNQVNQLLKHLTEGEEEVKVKSRKKSKPKLKPMKVKEMKVEPSLNRFSNFKSNDKKMPVYVYQNYVCGKPKRLDEKTFENLIDFSNLLKPKASTETNCSLFPAEDSLKRSLSKINFNSSSKNAFLHKASNKQKVPSELFNLCQSNTLFQSKPKRLEVKMEFYNKKESIIQSYCQLKGMIYQFGYLESLEVEEKYQAKMLDNINILYTNLRNLKASSDEELSDGKLSKAMKLENSPRKCEVKGHDMSFDVHTFAAIADKLIDQINRNTNEIDTQIGFYKNDRSLRQEENKKFSNDYPAKQISIENIGDFKKEFEEYKVQLDEVQCIQTTLSSTHMKYSKNIDQRKLFYDFESVELIEDISLSLATSDETSFCDRKDAKEDFVENCLMPNLIPNQLKLEHFIVIEHLISSYCHIKGLLWSYAILKGSKVENKNYEHFVANFLETDNVVAELQKDIDYAMKIENLYSERAARVFALDNDSTISSLKSIGNIFDPSFGVPKSQVTESSRTLSAKNLDKGLESYKLLLDQLEELRLSSNQSVQKILALDQTKKEKFRHLTEEILKTELPETVWPNLESSAPHDEMPIEEEINSKKWQHQRHIIAAPAIIIHLFKSNPAYQCSPIDCNAPNFFEELEQFYEMMAHPNSSLTQLINVSEIQKRLKVVLERVENRCAAGISRKEWRQLVAKIQLRQLLTHKERGAYEAMRWKLSDRSALDLTKEERLRDALNGMLGYECRQLRYSFRSNQLQLRSPEHQSSLSESYLLLALGHLGYLYRFLQNQQKELKALGETGLALAQSQRQELLLYKELQQKFEKCQKSASLFHIWKSSRIYQTVFQWIINLNILIFEEANLWKTLSKELVEGCQDNLLQKWLPMVSQTMLENLNRWLSFGELTAKNSEFFIKENLSASKENFWHERFTLVSKRVPLFLSNELSHLILNVGKCQCYAKEFLGLNGEGKLNYSKLEKAFHLTYQKPLNMEPLKELLMTAEQEISSSVLRHQEPAIDLFYKLFKYILLRDMHFVTKLIDSLGPLLEQSANSFNLQKFQFMLQQILTTDNAELYIKEVQSSGGPLCWSRVQLSWHLTDNWLALIGQSIQRYSTIFTELWKFHLANYILCERILRQQCQFGKRIKLEYLEDVKQMEQRFQALIDYFLNVINTLRRYLLINVLDEAYGRLKLKCNEAKTLLDIVEAHNQYLNAIAEDFFQTKQGKSCTVALNLLYSYVFDLDKEQQKFLTQCQMLIDFLRQCSDRERIAKCHLDFHLSCKQTWKILNDLGRKFRSSFMELKFNLNKLGGKKFKLLAKKLSAKNGERRLQRA